MPRIIDMHDQPFDYCANDFPSRHQAVNAYGVREDFSSIGYAAEHMRYQGSGLTCVECGATLTGIDD